MPKKRFVGKAELKHGDMTSMENHNFILQANKYLVNNANGVFSYRSENKLGTHNLNGKLCKPY
jgi:hypothetical protein